MIEQVGRYEILEKIGEGGFAIVYRAKDTALGRMVALKELRPILLNDSDWVKRFHREAKTVAQLDHPHIVPIHDVYDAEKRLFIVMRLIEGVSLDEHIQSHGGLPWAEAINIITQVAAGLDYAHAKGILHRDMKPANILMDKARGAMLTDFGLAKLTSQNSLSRSMSGTIVGTPHYIAPEVWEGQEFTPQADIYALGCIIYEILTGERAFKGDTPPSIMMAHFKPPALPPTWPSGVPHEIAQILLKALSTTPENRYATADALTQALYALNGNGENSYVVKPSPMPVSTPLPSEPIITPALPISSQSPLTPTGFTPTDIMASHQDLQVRLAMLEETLQREKTDEHVRHEQFVAVSQEMHQERKKGCFWGTMIFAGLLMVFMIIGFAVICTATDRITANINQLVANFFPQFNIGELTTEAIEIPMPTDTEMTRLEIAFSSGELLINKGHEPFLLQGQARYNVDLLAPVVLTDTHYIRLQTEGTIGAATLINQSVINQWDVKLGGYPLDLVVKTDGAKATLNLGGLALQSVIIEQNLASATINFSETNRVLMNHFQLNGTAADVTLVNLANTQAETMGFNLGLGDYSLEFDGELKQDIDVIIQGGAGGMGNIEIVMPATTHAIVTLDDKFDNLNSNAPWQQSADDENEYIIAGSGPTIKIEIQRSSGNLTLTGK